jgi:DHA1 family tetracycline resistance protein-like MFS transporter
LVQGGGIARLARRWGDRRVAHAGTILLATSLIALPLLPAPAFIAAVMTTSAGQAMLTPTLSSLLSQTVDRTKHGAVLGAGQSAGAAARATGPLCAGALFDTAHPLPAIAGAITVLAAALVLLRQPASNRPGPEQVTSPTE